MNSISHCKKNASLNASIFKNGIQNIDKKDVYSERPSIKPSPPITIPVPKQGDIIWVHFNQTQGNEIFGKRPALVISPLIKNKQSWIIQVCPITSKVKGIGFEVPIKTKKIDGVILTDQIRTIDRRMRILPSNPESAPIEILRKVQEDLKLLFFERKVI